MKSISGYLSYRSSYTGKKKDIHTIMFIVFLFIIAKCENDLKCPSLNNLNSFVIVPSLSCVQLFETPWNAAQRASLTFTISQSLLKLMSIESMMPSNHLILCHSLLLLPSIFPSIGVFSNESALCIRWLKYWSFSFSISPSNEYSRLIPLGWIGWISLQSKGLSKDFSNTTVRKHQFIITQPSLWSNS